jgi:MFS family permease
VKALKAEAAASRGRSPLLPIFLIVVVDVLGLTIILPLLPFYAERLGASPTVVGLLVSSYAACQLIAGPLLGQISDRMGRRPLLLVSQMGTFIGFLILAWAGSLWLVFLARIIDGLTAGNLSLAQAYISDVTRPEERAKSFGVIGVAFGIGFLIGPAISGFLSTFGYQFPIFAAAALSATSILSTYFLLPSVSPAPESNGEAGPPAPAGRRLRVLDWGRCSRDCYGSFFVLHLRSLSSSRVSHCSPRDVIPGRVTRSELRKSDTYLRMWASLESFCRAD